MINYVFKGGFPHLRATSVCPNVLQYTRAYLNHFTNRRGRFYHLRKRFGHCSLLFCGVVHIGQAARFGIFLKSASRLVPDGWVGLKSFGYRCHFRAFQLELDTLDTQNIGNGPVVEELQGSTSIYNV